MNNEEKFDIEIRQHYNKVFKPRLFHLGSRVIFSVVKKRIVTGFLILEVYIMKRFLIGWFYKRLLTPGTR